MPFALNVHLVDVVAGTIMPARLHWSEGHIQEIEPLESLSPKAPYALPGLVDAHIHIESSMLRPSAFARAAVRFGTVATISDPHEIANVCGLEGVRFMLQDAATTPFLFHFGAPSCVPATDFEHAGAILEADQIEAMLGEMNLGYLSEMMNFPGVIAGVPSVMAKIEVAQRLGKPIDGHAPGVRGEALDTYIAAGISTDHESFTYAEAREKIEKGLKILIREGSAARNFEELWPLIDEFPDQVMLCSDDLHPDELVQGHLDRLLRRGVARGLNPLNLIRAATLNPIRHYGLTCGLLQAGDNADFVLVRDLTDFEVLQTVIGGETVYKTGQTLLTISGQKPQIVNNFGRTEPVKADEFKVEAANPVHVVVALDGQIVTERSIATLPLSEKGGLLPDTTNDVLKIVVVNRYQMAPPAVAFVQGFGLEHGAIASSVAHDSHNIVAVGVSDDDLASAINAVIARRGGLSFAMGNEVQVLPLPIAGLMSDDEAPEVATAYSALDKAVKNAGTPLAAPFMTLSFMALPVIPRLKMTDQGLFDVETFAPQKLTAPTPPGTAH